MRRVFVAPAAVFLVLHPTRLILLVLGRRVVPAFTLRTFKCDNVSHIVRPLSDSSLFATVPSVR